MAEVRPPSLYEAEAYAELLTISFGLAPDQADRLVQEHLPDSVRVAVADGAVMAGLLTDRQAQSWGGRLVPVACIVGVAVAPESRRQGWAFHLLRAVLGEHRTQGTALAALYANNPQLYRSLGFEQAGLRWVAKVSPAQVGGTATAAVVRRLTPQDLPAMKAIYRQVVLNRRDGALERSDRRWRRALGLQSEGRPWWVGAFDDSGALTGYIVWRGQGTIPKLSAVVLDFVAGSVAAATALRGVLSQLSSTVQSIELATAPDDPALWWADSARPHLMERLFIRVLEPAGAVGQWGFPAAVDQALHGTWADPIFPDGDGPFTLEVSSGRGAWTQGGPGGARLTPRALAALLAGRVAPAELAILDGPSLGSGTPWSAVFPRRSVWMRDPF